MLWYLCNSNVRSFMGGSCMKEERKELKELIEKMNAEQFNWFISQMRFVLSEEAGKSDLPKACPEIHT